MSRAVKLEFKIHVVMLCSIGKTCELSQVVIVIEFLLNEPCRTFNLIDFSETRNKIMMSKARRRICIRSHSYSKLNSRSFSI